MKRDPSTSDVLSSNSTFMECYGTYKNFVWLRKHFDYLKLRIEPIVIKSFRPKKSSNFFQIKVLRGHVSLNGRFLEISKTVPLKEQLENVSEGLKRTYLNTVVCKMNYYVCSTYSRKIRMMKVISTLSSYLFKPI